MVDNRFRRVEEVAKELDVSKPYAYKVIKALNEEMKSMGFMVVAGRVNRAFFEKKFCYQGQEEM